MQMGDVLDRGRNELAVIEMLERLRVEAEAVGGKVITLLGNHDAMNINGIFINAPNTTGFLPNRFAFGEQLHLNDQRLQALPLRSHHRAAAFLPGGPAARLFARTRKGVVIVGDSVFVHAVIDMMYVSLGLEAINAALTTWMEGSSAHQALPYRLWRLLQDRDFGRPAIVLENSGICDVINDVIQTLNVSRVVVAHTPQWAGINGVCGGKLWRVDAALSLMTSMKKPMEVSWGYWVEGMGGSERMSIYI